VEDGEPVGCLLAQPISYCDDAPLTVWVDDLAVRPERRRRGVATALYRAFGAWASGVGVRAALTRVPPDDPAARALHRRVGFAAHATGALVWRFDDA
jgi:GNAT superfamily N-acetyltransferase